MFRRRTMNADERRRVERVLLASMVECGEPPSPQELSVAAGIDLAVLRRSLASVDALRRALVLDTVTVARSCADLRRAWHPSLRVLAERLVVHRLYVHRIVAPVLRCALADADARAEFGRLEGDLRRQIEHQIDRWADRADAAHVAPLVDALDEVLRLQRIDAIVREVGERSDEALVADVLAVLARHGVVDRWSSLRHRWWRDEPSVADAVSCARRSSGVR